MAKSPTPPKLPALSAQPAAYSRERWEHYGVRLPSAVLNEIRKRAKASGQPISVVMREALYRGLGFEVA